MLVHKMNGLIFYLKGNFIWNIIKQSLVQRKFGKNLLLIFSKVLFLVSKCFLDDCLNGRNLRTQRFSWEMELVEKKSDFICENKAKRGFMWDQVIPATLK